MKFLKDDSGIAFAMVYIMMGLIAVCAVYVIGGIVVDEFEILSTDLSASEMWETEQYDRVQDLIKIWDMVLWLVVGCSLLFGIVTAIRKERRGALE